MRRTFIHVVGAFLMVLLLGSSIAAGVYVGLEWITRTMEAAR